MNTSYTIFSSFLHAFRSESFECFNRNFEGFRIIIIFPIDSSDYRCISLCFTLLGFTDVVFFTHWRHAPPPTKNINSLYWIIRIIAVVWKQTCNISDVCLFFAWFQFSRSFFSVPHCCVKRGLRYHVLLELAWRTELLVDFQL